MLKKTSTYEDTQENPVHDNDFVTVEMVCVLSMKDQTQHRHDEHLRIELI